MGDTGNGEECFRDIQNSFVQLSKRPHDNLRYGSDQYHDNTSITVRCSRAPVTPGATSVAADI